MKPAGRRPLLFALLAVAVGAAAFAAWSWWRASERTRLIAAAVPPRPDLTGWHDHLGQRLAAGEQRLRAGDDPLAALGELSRLYHANGFFEEAAFCYRTLVRVDPAEARWAHRLAAIHAGYGELDAAIPLWAHVVARAPRHLPARVRLGDAELKRGDLAPAEKHYAAALAQDANQPFALLGLARVAIARDDWPRARESLEHAAQLSGFAIGGDLLATAYEKTGDAARATALRGRTRSSGAFHDIPDAWLEELFFECFDPYRIAIAAGMAGHRGDHATAARLLERALTLAPDDAALQLQAGLLHSQHRNYAPARTHLARAVALDPDYADAWGALHELLLTVGRAAEAERALADGLARCPDAAVLHLLRARRLSDSGRPAEAITAFAEAIRLRPEQADAYLGLARASFAVEQVAEGVAALERAQRVEPDHPLVLTTLALHGIRSGDAAGAARWLERVRDQPRVPREDLHGLVQAFRERFGHAPW